MADLAAALRAQLGRQVAHWGVATARLQKPGDLASEGAWQNLEKYLGITLRKHLALSVERLERHCTALRGAFQAARSVAELQEVANKLLDFRQRYLKTETTLEFYADAIRSRTSPEVGAVLRGCDSLAHRSMSLVLDQLGKPVPATLTFIDKGMGALILKARLRLWDGSESPVASIKITRHNLHRPTSLIHETGHQVAHIAGWNEELAGVLREGLHGSTPRGAQAWSGWASEIAADAHAFVHTGYAAVAALHDVLAGEESQVFRHTPGDPHPVGYLRVLLGAEMCRAFYGEGPWDDLALAWGYRHPLEGAPAGVARLIEESLPHLRQIAELTLSRPMRAFGGRPLSALVRPERVAPHALREMEREIGGALYTSTHWAWTESLRILALNGLRLATEPERAAEIVKEQESWMFTLGGTLQAA
ncbi:hypothetical protein LPW11_04425 [Geomonas sp. RF6]|uniref:hypothetical protein n=1 Tax=Geomonas sp. RF6 TaxID=2897342 RepID=UPI001E2FA4D1|nr:hypothetical protein [Geomonas sp. RF6]UFS71445.1 hypothetical protein LPW11_04425 [Geomonas sp. RF6]